MFDPVRAFYARENEAPELAPRELPMAPRDVLFERLVRDHGPTSATIAAFNEWVLTVAKKQIKCKTVCDDKGIYTMDNVRLLKPAMPNGMPLFPCVARQSALTYAGDLVADVRRIFFDPVDAESEDEYVARDYFIGKIPVMLGSVACHLSGYSSAERKAVYEDTDDPLGYFIIKGTERLIMFQDTIAPSQQVSIMMKGGVIMTSITAHRVRGMTVVSAETGKSWPRIKINVKQPGTMGSSKNTKYPLFVLFDVVFQVNDPKRFGYVDAPGLIDLEREVSAEERALIRERIVQEAQALILRFVPDNEVLRARVLHFLESSRISYSAIENPISDIIKRKTDGTSIVNVAQSSLMSLSRRSASSFVETTDVHCPRKLFREASSARRSSVIAERCAAASEAEGCSLFLREIEAVAKDSMTGTASISYARCVRYVVIDLLSDLFPDTYIDTKPTHLARLVAQQCLVSIGHRPFDNRDAWQNKRVKPAADWLMQIFNGFFKMNLNKTGTMTVDSTITDQFVSSFGAGGMRNRERVVHLVKRDTPISITAQIGRLKTPASPKSKQMTMRHVQFSQTGFVCPSETPTSNACGLTKNLACTTWVSIRRDQELYVEEVVLPVARARYGAAATAYAPERPHGVFVDGVLHAWVYAPDTIADFVRTTKTRPEFFDVTVVFNRADSVVEIFTTGGRLCRPLYTVGARGLAIDELDMPAADAHRLPFDELIRLGAVEFVSASEQQYYFVSQFPEAVPEHLARRARERAADPAKTHLRMLAEIDPVAILGVAAAAMPFPETCQGPRVTYQSSMITQSIGLYNDSFYNRFDKKFKRMAVSRPTLETRISRPVGLNRSPAGRMLLVAYLSLGNNGEDAIVANYDAFAHITMTKYSTHKIVIRTPTPDALSYLKTGVGNLPANTVFEWLTKPDASQTRKPGVVYHALSDDGLPRVGACITKGDCIVGKVKVVTDQGKRIAEPPRDTSVFAGVGDEGVVDSVVVSPQYTIYDKLDHRGAVVPSTVSVRVRIRQTRPIVAGDKMASRYAQKGTIGAMRSNTQSTLGNTEMAEDYTSTRIEKLAKAHSDTEIQNAIREEDTIVNEEEGDVEAAGIRFMQGLPRVASGPNKGVTPDIIINPAGMPGRMTIGKLYEMLMNKAALYTGQRVDGTAFRSITDAELDDVYATLNKAGVGEYESFEHPDGTPFMDGVRVFIAPCFYQFIKHTVLDKIQYRSTGNIDPRTLQPVGGRTNEGGLRQGEMEKSAMCSWGAAELVTERMSLASDAFDYEICAKCGTQATTDHILETYTCKTCGDDKAEIGIVTTPFTQILVADMVGALGINVKYSDLARDTRCLN